MDDRKLIEMAAKAAEIKLHVWGAKGRENFADVTDESNHKLWNPLADDAAAFRLAVKLNLQFGFDAGFDDRFEDLGARIYCTYKTSKHSSSSVGQNIKAAGGKEAAARRAVTMAAAAIAEQQHQGGV